VNTELVATLRAEYAAIFAYGVIGVRLPEALARAARNAEAAHRARRDELLVQLSAAGVGIPGEQPAYELPFKVTDEASALRLAIEVEERTGAYWRAVLPVTAGDGRAPALDALTGCARRATYWRRQAGVSPIVVDFPGRTA